MRRKRFWDKRLATLVILALAACLGIAQLAPPSVLPESAPLEAFSAARAMRHVVALSQRPHPTGSPEQAAVRDYLLSELAALGFEAEVQRASAVLPHSGTVGLVENVVARMPGSSSSGAILLVAHYDTVAVSPGAGDNATGVAVVLETLRALRASKPLANELMVLFSDAEEIGLVGARAFVAQHPWMVKVRVVLNLDTFTSGPAVMWRTSPRNGWLIRQFASSVARPVATSWSDEAARLLPYDTDFTPFRTAGVAGYDFWTTYSYPEAHTAQERLEIVRPESVQHAGDQALALVRHLGDVSLESIAEPDAVFFTLWGPLFVHYPACWALPLAILIAALFLAVVGIGFRRRRLTWPGVGLALGISSAYLVGLPLLFGLAWQVIWALCMGESAIGQTTHLPHDWLYAVCLLSLTVSLVAWGHRWARRRISLPDMATGVLMPWLVLLLLSGSYLSGFSYMLAWPLLSAILALAWVTFAPPATRASWGGWLVLMLSATPALILWAPAMCQFFEGTAMGLIWLLIAAMVLVMGLLTTQLDLLLRKEALEA
jgi:hypothetical protein